MTLGDIFTSRNSIRCFLPKAVENEKLQHILEAGRLAPSACNKQPWTFLVINELEAKKALCNCYSRSWFAEAPLYIVIIGHHNEAWSRPSGNSVDIDTSIATTQMMLQAHELGLSSTWVCAFDQDLCKKLFGMSEEMEPVSILAIGYADENRITQTDKKRKSLEEVVKYNQL